MTPKTHECAIDGVTRVKLLAEGDAFGDYRVVCRLGKGGMVEGWLASCDRNYIAELAKLAEEVVESGFLLG